MAGRATVHCMTLAHWFTHREHGGFPVEKAALGSLICRCCMSRDDTRIVERGSHTGQVLKKADLSSVHSGQALR